LSEESDEQDYFDEDFEDDYDNEEDIISSLLNKDIENFQELYGKTSIEIRVHAGINEVDVILYIDMGFLDVHTSSAWGVNRDIPVTLHVHLQSASKYLDGPEPKIEVYQGSPDSKDKIIFGLGNQMRKIVEGFLSTQWKTTSNYFLEQAYETVAIREPVTSQLTPTNTPPSTLPDATSDSLMALLGMGFDLELAKQALEMCEQKVEKAVHLLTSGELLDDEDEEENKTEKDNASGATVPVEFERQDSQGARAMLSADNNLDKVKQIPSLEHGFLVQIMKYLLNRIPSLNEFCVICDERHVLETGLIKPCVCTRELCVFAFQTLGVMADTAESVATDADVVDLMIAMCNAAASSNRASVILDPYPSIVDPCNSHRLAMDPSKKNFEEVKTVLAAIINGREELLRGRCTHQSLKCALDQHHNLAFPLMQWYVVYHI
jgi:poly [ADP-ribose] polymerase 6/8